MNDLSKVVDKLLAQGLLGLGRKFYGMVGTPGTTPFSTVVDATNARKVLNRQLAPVNDRRIVLDPDAEAAALGLSGFADVSKSGDARPIIDGTIGRKYGFDWAMDQQVPSFEASVMTEGALTVNGANEAGAQVVSLAFHRDAIAFATRPLMDSANGLGNLTQSAVDPVSGLSLRLEVSREHKRTRFSYDILYGADVVRRELGCRIAG
ncbi:P22 phage major capsid protein family protein [Bilophila wadsworthia]|uniref:P22 phage major capsid protein family protein n=1 Tax=Bilophila wadsworthia TaxID=35833 RepID=UPI003AB40D1A